MTKPGTLTLPISHAPAAGDAQHRGDSGADATFPIVCPGASGGELDRERVSR